ncbi:hypothetical protein SLS58_001893 [Diplodia intermedia]|uniref:Uncharacterized protein n=1 Tax=Diplodia intermedia TaxID=856260 RepID=A0ABR3U047_9PEZI
MAGIPSGTPLQASGIRRARTYEPIVRGNNVCEEYPVGCSAFLTSIHDARYYQGILSNAHNFSQNTKCEVFQIKDGKAEWKHQLDDANTLEYLKVQFFCQQPRWNIHKKDIPWSVYMTHYASTQSTTYLVVCSEKQPRNEIVKERLHDMFTYKRAKSKALGGFVDPFMLHLTIIHEAFVEAKAIITDMRYKLYDQLDRVDQYCMKNTGSREKNELEDLTIRLHTVSQDTDSMSASADMAGMILRRISEAHHRYAGCVQEKDKEDSLMKTTDAIKYLSTSVESQLRWLASYKSRKDIAMNLVFNLVTQQDASTSTAIARETEADGKSMKIIAALTMLFLPGTFLSSVFGMSSLDHARWWLYLAITLPMTLLVIGAWWLWLTFGEQKKKRAAAGTTTQRLLGRF